MSRGLHALVLLSAVLLHHLVVGRLLPVLALDVEGLVYNLYLDWTTDEVQRWFARADWTGAMGALIRWGPVPVSLLGFVALGYRVAEAWQPGSDPLPSLPARVRWGLGIACVLALGASLPPLSLALAMWLAVESYAWIEWYSQVEPLVEWLTLDGAPLIAACVLGFGLLVTLMALGPRRSAWRHPLRVRGVGSLGRVAIALAVLAPAVALAVPFGVHASRVDGLRSGRAVWGERCGGCHERALPLYFVKAEAEWPVTVATHRNIEGVALDDAEAAALTDFLQGMRSFGDAWTFRARCQSCHGSTWKRWEERTEEDWGLVVRRLGLWSPYFYNGAVQEQLVRFLAQTKGTDAQDFGVANYGEYADTIAFCDDCHSVYYEAERYAELDRDAVHAMVERMNDKVAKPASDAELQRHTDRYRELLADPALFDRLAPHDLPEPTGAIPWLPAD
jgi:hypothetical protein